MKETQTIIQSLFKAGSHFGFSKSRRHPSVSAYLFGTKEGTDIFDLERTSTLLANASEYLKELGEQGKTVLFVSSKEEIRDIVRAQADSVNMPFVTNRWIGGVLTNFSEIKKRIQRMISLRDQALSGELDKKYTKKERLMLSREVEKLAFNFGGVEKVERLPDALLVVDPRHDKVAVKEANDAKVPVIAIMSSDCDMSVIAKPVLANDASRESVSFVLAELTAAYADGKSRFVPKVAKVVPPRDFATRTAA